MRQGLGMGLRHGLEDGLGLRHGLGMGLRHGLENGLGLRHGLEAWGREGWLGLRHGGEGWLGLNNGKRGTRKGLNKSEKYLPKSQIFSLRSKN